MRTLLCILLASIPALATPALAQEAPATTEITEENKIDRRVRRLSDEMRSPFCPGKTIMACTSGQAYTLRQEMRDMVVSGLSDEEIMTQLAERYGEDIRNPPQPWYTVVVPFLPFVFGGILVVLVLRRWRRGAKAREQAPPKEDEEVDSAALAKLRARVAALDEE